MISPASGLLGTHRFLGTICNITWEKNYQIGVNIFPRIAVLRDYSLSSLEIASST